MTSPAHRFLFRAARSVLVDVLSSDGAIDLEVEVYNDAAGYDIDYATGAFSVAGE